MIQRIKKNQKGFTLIELMIVVAIIGILAAIAIPNFLQYQLKSKTAEAKTNIGAIRTSLEAFKAENDFFPICVNRPRAVAGLTAAKFAWGAPAAGTGWPEIGFVPSGDVYYSYEVTIGAPASVANKAGILAASLGTNMCIGLAADLDGNGAALATAGQYGFATAIAAPAPTTPTTLSALPAAANNLEDLNPGDF